MDETWDRCHFKLMTDPSGQAMVSGPSSVESVSLDTGEGRGEE
jgi:hypothetical protein